MADGEEKKEGVVNKAKPLRISLVLTKFRNSEVVTYEDRYGDRKRAVVIPLEDNDLYETINGAVNITLLAVPLPRVHPIDLQTHLVKQVYSKDFFDRLIKGEKFKTPIMGNVKEYIGDLKVWKDIETHFEDYYTNYSCRYHLSMSSRRPVRNYKKHKKDE